MALHIQVNNCNVVGRHLVINYMRTPLTRYYLEFSVRVAYMETHPYTRDTIHMQHFSSQYYSLEYYS
jgi:hypothetical protein